MGDYTEHLISMAGGDGDGPLSAIEAHLKSMGRAHRMSCSDPTDPERSTTYGESAKAIAYLLSLVREQAAQIGRVEAVHRLVKWKPGQPRYAGSDDLCEWCGTVYPCPTIAALTATEDQA